MAQSIKIHIGASTYSLKANSEKHEELLRQSATMISRKLEEYQRLFPDRELLELMSILSLNLCASYVGMKNDLDAHNNSIMELNEEIETYLNEIK